MENHRSVKAKTRCRIRLFSTQQIVGSGSYEQQQSASGPRFRRELTIKLPAKTSTFTEVFDGTTLWTYECLWLQPKHDGEKPAKSGEKLTTVSAKRVADRLKQTDRLRDPTKIGPWPGLGGLPRLLRELNAHFTFSEVEQTAFTTVGPSGQRALPVWKLSGRWNPGQLARLLPEQAEDIKAGKPANLGDLPSQAPDQVVVCLGKDDLFPYRIDYRRSVPRRFWNRGREESRSIVTMEFTEVSLDVPIKTSQFTYTPAGLTPVDRTSVFLKGLNLK